MTAQRVKGQGSAKGGRSTSEQDHSMSLSSNEQTTFFVKSKIIDLIGGQENG